MAQNVHNADFGPLSVRGRYNRSDAGTGPTFSVWVNGKEAIRADFYPNSPQGRHYHEKPYVDPSNAVSTIVLKEVADDGTLLEHIVENLQVIIKRTVGHELTPANNAEVGRFIAAMYYLLNLNQ